MSAIVTKVLARMNKIADALERCDGDVDAATRLLISEMSQGEKDDALFTYYRDHVRAQVRIGTHAAEASMPTTGSPSLEQLEAMDSNTIYLPDGRKIEWLDMTAEDHRSRGQWFEKRGKSMLATAKKHYAAADEIEKRGVTCLRDLLP